MEPLRILHPYNAGDLITILPGLHHLWKTRGIKTILYQRLNLPVGYHHNWSHPIQDEQGHHVCMNAKTWQLLCPLLEAQPYIEKMEVWTGQPVDWDFTKTRDSRFIPLPNSSIHHWPMFIFPDLACDLSEKWIYLPEDTNPLYDTILITRTSRYINPYITYYFLKGYEHKIAFAGLPAERDAFCETWGVDIPLLIINNFLDLAQCINSCRFLVSNQTFIWHLADALKVPRILEVCGDFPNTLPTGANGRAILHQQALEHYFQQLSIKVINLEAKPTTRTHGAGQSKKIS